VTIDGLSPDHDKTRPLKNGHPTFSKIMQNLLGIKDQFPYFNFRFDLRVNFNDRTAAPEKRTDFLKAMHLAFGSDNRFRLRFRPIADFAKQNNTTADDSSFCPKLQCSALKKEFENEAVAQGFMLADNDLFAGNGSFSCYAGLRNNYVVTPDLAVRKCTVALNNPMNIVGLLAKGGVFVKNSNLERWVENKVDSSCKNCFFFNQCRAAACPLANIIAGKAICPDSKSEFAHQAAVMVTQLNYNHNNEEHSD
jgi:uncharacterized protein